MKLFRLPKEAFSYILEQITPALPIPRRSDAVPAIIKLSVTLRFLAEGSYQTGAGQDLNIGLAQQTVSKVLWEVVEAMENILCPTWISLQMTDIEKAESKRFYYKKYGFPGVIGAIDGSHIQMLRPVQDEHIYFNRKLQHSVNAMVVCVFTFLNIRIITIIKLLYFRFVIIKCEFDQWMVFSVVLVMTQAYGA